ncbi:MAG: hypothetical protein HQK59_13335 [Deltaproteobacteria bacterium]|nr:hypothetical protein [Deltaproteobacteria bacterium]
MGIKEFILGLIARNHFAKDVRKVLDQKLPLLYRLGLTAGGVIDYMQGLTDRTNLMERVV